MASVVPLPTTRSLFDQLEELPVLRPFPTVATRLMAACQDPDSSSKSIADIIQCDAGLALRLLRLANSPMYGFANKIRSVDHAVVVLGFRCVRDLGLSMAGADMFVQGDDAAEQRMALWQHSLGCATVARLLAERVSNVSPNEAFLGGIFHDVGKLIFYDLVPDDYIRLTAGSPSPSLVEQERQTFDVTHEQVGMRCSEDWRLPQTITHAIGYHHAPESAPGDRLFVSLIHVADLLAKAWKVGSDEECVAVAEEISSDNLLELDAADIDAAFARAPTEFEEMARACMVS